MAYKILVIDDDTELLRMLKRYFEIKKYGIITAENGIEGLNKIKFQPDLILLDVNMPDIDGIEVCRKIRDKVTCPVLFPTARVEEQDVVVKWTMNGRYWFQTGRRCRKNIRKPWLSRQRLMKLCFFM